MFDLIYCNFGKKEERKLELLLLGLSQFLTLAEHP